MYIMEYHTAIRKNESLLFVAAGIVLEYIMINEIRQRKTNTLLT